MVIRIELRIFDQIVTSVSFEPKNGNPPKYSNCEDKCVPKRLHWQSYHLGGSYLFMKYDVFRQNADFFRNGADQRSFTIPIMIE